MRDERGFTLIELLVVVLINGILAAIVLPTFLSQAEKARDVNAKADVRKAVSQKTGTVFAIERLDGGYRRDCTAPGAGGCRPDGSW